MYDEPRSLDPRQRRRVEQRLAVLAYASTCSMNAAAPPDNGATRGRDPLLTGDTEQRREDR
jgi:hypothetical protein